MGYLFLFLLILVHGVREGFTWADSTERLTNVFITNRIGNGIAKIDYHGWRSIEYVCIIVICVCKLKLIPVIGIFMMGQFLYNGILHYICGEGFFYDRTEDFPWLGLTIDKKYLTWKTDILQFIVGTIIFILCK